MLSKLKKIPNMPLLRMDYLSSCPITCYTAVAATVMCPEELWIVCIYLGFSDYVDSGEFRRPVRTTRQLSKENQQMPVTLSVIEMTSNCE